MGILTNKKSSSTHAQIYSITWTHTHTQTNTHKQTHTNTHTQTQTKTQNNTNLDFLDGPIWSTTRRQSNSLNLTEQKKSFRDKKGTRQQKSENYLTGNMQSKAGDWQIDW